MRIKVEVPIRATGIYYLDIDEKDPNEFEDAIDEEIDGVEPDKLEYIDVDFDNAVWEER